MSSEMSQGEKNKYIAYAAQIEAFSAQIKAYATKVEKAVAQIESATQGYWDASLSETHKWDHED
jgi:hypothetical protein